MPPSAADLTTFHAELKNLHKSRDIARGLSRNASATTMPTTSTHPSPVTKSPRSRPSREETRLIRERVLRTALESGPKTTGELAAALSNAGVYNYGFLRQAMPCYAKSTPFDGARQVKWVMRTDADAAWGRPPYPYTPTGAQKRANNVAPPALTLAPSDIMFLAAPVEPASSPLLNLDLDLPPSPAAMTTMNTSSAAVETPVTPPVLQPLASLSQDGVLAQIEHWSGLSLTLVPNKDGHPLGHVTIPEEQVSALYALCMFKRKFEEDRRAKALAAVRSEIKVDRSRFLDLAEFQTELPDLRVDNFEAISKQSPSAATRAKNLDAAAKMSNTKRIQRLKADAPTKTDIPVFQAAHAALCDERSPIKLAVDIDGVMEFMPLGVSPEACTEAMNYLARNNVIAGNGSGDHRTWYANETSGDRLSTLISTIRK